MVRDHHIILISSSIIFRTSYQMLTIKPVMLEGNYVLLRPPSPTDVFGLSRRRQQIGPFCQDPIYPYITCHNP
jgi:hypothetical protein